MSPGRERRRIWPVAVMLALVALFLVANAALAWRNARAVAAAERWVAHTREVRLEVQALLSTVQDAESGQRGYLLTGEDAFLGPYRGAVARANARLTSLARLTPDDPEQEKSFAEVRRLAVARMT